MSEKLRQYKKSIWRVPLITIIAGYFYAPVYVQLVLKFGMIEPGVLDDRVSLIVSADILLAVLVLGGILLLRKLSREEIFVSAAVVFVYGNLLYLISLLVGNMTGIAAAIWILYLSKPLEWADFFLELSSYLENHFGVSLPIIGWLRVFVPFLFVLFGKSE